MDGRSTETPWPSSNWNHPMNMAVGGLSWWIGSGPASAEPLLTVPAEACPEGALLGN